MIAYFALFVAAVALGVALRTRQAVRQANHNINRILREELRR